jgi:phosphate transport system substrate-binding protein
MLNGNPDCQSETTQTVNSSDAVVQAVLQTSGSVSALELTYLVDPVISGTLNLLSYDGVPLTAANLGNGTYEIASDAHMYTLGEATGLAQSFLEYVLSDDIQKTVIPALGFGPVR